MPSDCYIHTPSQQFGSKEEYDDDTTLILQAGILKIMSRLCLGYMDVAKGQTCRKWGINLVMCFDLEDMIL